MNKRTCLKFFFFVIIELTRYEKEGKNMRELCLLKVTWGGAV